MKRVVLLFAILGIVLNSAQPVVAQERTAVKQGFELKANSGKRILVFRPTVRVGSQSTGGLFEPNADWTDQARANIEASLDEMQTRLGNEVIEAPDAFGEEAQNLQEHMELFSAISRSVIN